MKNSITKVVTIFMLLLANAFYAQNIVTVDNNINSSANFTSLQSAIDSAENNDFIYLYPSELSYGNCTIDKKVHLRGIGHTPEVSNGIPASVGTINFINNNPATNAIASGGSISGLVIAGVSLPIANNINNITIENNKIGNIGSSNNNDNWVIRGNIFSNNISVGPACNNWLIVNNFFNLGPNSALAGLRNDTNVNNNVFVLPSSSTPFNIFSDSFCIASNNIFIAQNAAVTSVNVAANGSNVILSNNLSFNTAGTALTALPGTGNYNNTNPSFVSITPSTNYNYSIANNYQISNAALVGTDGTPIGIFGLNFPFNSRGYSFSMPYIESMTILNPTIPVNGTLQIDVTAKSN